MHLDRQPLVSQPTKRNVSWQIRKSHGLRNSMNQSITITKYQKKILMLTKYSRPKTMDDIASQEQAVLVLKKALQSDNVIFFYETKKKRFIFVTDDIIRIVTSFTFLWTSRYW